MKKLLRYTGFIVLVFVLLTLWDFLSSGGADLASNAVHTLITSAIYLGYDFFQSRRK